MRVETTTTMDIPFLLKGIIIGFSIAAPVGPIGVLCIRRTLADGRLTGLISGLGAATADLFYGCIAAFGLTFISQFLIDQEWHFHILKWLENGMDHLFIFLNMNQSNHNLNQNQLVRTHKLYLIQDHNQLLKQV